MRKKLTLPVLLLLSAVGLALQYWNQATGYDLFLLPIPGAPGAVVTKIYTALCVVVAFALAFELSGVTLKRSDGLHHTLTVPGMAVGVLAGVLTALGGLGKLVVDVMPLLRWRQTTGIFNCLVDILVLCAGGAMVWLALSPKRPHKPGPALAPLIPGFAGCFRLAVFYHANSQDPVVSHYGWALLGLMAFILASYYQAGFSFNRCRPFRALLFTCLAVPLLFLALPTVSTWYDLVLLAGFGVWMLVGVEPLLQVSQVRGHREAPPQ